MVKYTDGCRDVFIFIILLSLTGCGNTQAEPDVKEMTENVDTALPSGESQPPEKSQQPEKVKHLQEPTELYQQMLLYIREGLYRHGIEGTYQAYFGAVENDGEKQYWRDGSIEAYGDGYFCQLLLEGEGNLWSESLAYTYDEDSGWYTFYGQYEPVLAGNLLWAAFEDSDFVLNMKENYVYTCQISGKTDFPYPMKYLAENAPVEKDMRIDIPFSEAWRGASGASADRLSYGVYPRLYTYVDDRLDMYITILYPEISLEGAYDNAERMKVEDIINERIKAAFFYSYYTEDGDTLNPHTKLYGNIERNYIITRRDNNYLSMRIYESNYFRHANHPNEWETAITFDMRTGKVLNLGDIVGEDRTMGDLFGTGAFECMWFWENDTTGEEWMSRYTGENTLPCSECDGDFYLTDKSLGLITAQSRYYTNIEADFKDLGIDGF